MVPGAQGSERFILCRSAARAAKESAMLAKQMERLRGHLVKLDASLRERPAREVGPIERRIGRWLGRSTAAEAVFEVMVEKDAEGRACGLTIRERSERLEWARLAQGAYLLRTNHPSEDPAQLWRWYIQLTQAEAAFRTTKSDLHLRPIYHHTAERVEAHILVCFLALALWRTLEQWLHAKGLGECGRQLLLELEELRSLDVVLPTEGGNEIRVRMVARPEKELAFLLARLGLDLPETPKAIEYVVQKTPL